MCINFRESSRKRICGKIVPEISLCSRASPSSIYVHFYPLDGGKFYCLSGWKTCAFKIGFLLLLGDEPHKFYGDQHIRTPFSTNRGMNKLCVKSGGCASFNILISFLCTNQKYIKESKKLLSVHRWVVFLRKL